MSRNTESQGAPSFDQLSDEAKLETEKKIGMKEKTQSKDERIEQLQKQYEQAMQEYMQAAQNKEPFAENLHSIAEEIMVQIRSLDPNGENVRPLFDIGITDEVDKLNKKNLMN